MRLRSSIGVPWRRNRLRGPGGVGVIALEVLGLTCGLARVLRVKGSGVVGHLCGFLTINDQESKSGKVETIGVIGKRKRCSFYMNEEM
jgi:uncharacterized protein affecting Mg2+/Co2+ transport